MISKQVGSYQIVSLLGSGGMGEVYLARDTKLGRNVAIKVLPSFVANDPDRLTRFGREAMRFSANADAVEAMTPQPLFATNVGSTAPNTNRQQYAVSPDGKSFILNSQPDAAQISPITVILNWKPER